MGGEALGGEAVRSRSPSRLTVPSAVAPSRGPGRQEPNYPEPPPCHQPMGNQPSAAEPQTAAGSCAAGVRTHTQLKIPRGCLSSTLTPRADAASSPTQGRAGGVPRDARIPVCAGTGADAAWGLGFPPCEPRVQGLPLLGGCCLYPLSPDPSERLFAC